MLQILLRWKNTILTVKKAQETLFRDADNIFPQVRTEKRKSKKFPTYWTFIIVNFTQKLCIIVEIISS